MYYKYENISFPCRIRKHSTVRFIFKRMERHSKSWNASATEQNRTEKKKKPSTQQNLWWLHPINAGKRKENVMFLFSFFYTTITSRVSAAVKSNKWIYYWHVYEKSVIIFTIKPTIASSATNVDRTSWQLSKPNKHVEQQQQKQQPSF